MVYLSMGSIISLLEQSLAEGTLEKLPRDRLPEQILAGRILDALEWGNEVCRPDVEARIRELQPVFRFKWGYMALEKNDAFEDCPASIDVSIYVDAALEDPELLTCFADAFPEEINEILAEAYEPVGEHVKLDPFVSDGDRWCAAMISFPLDGDPQVVSKKWAEIGKMLAMLVERLGEDIQLFIEEANAL